MGFIVVFLEGPVQIKDAAALPVVAGTRHRLRSGPQIRAVPECLEGGGTCAGAVGTLIEGIPGCLQGGCRSRASPSANQALTA